MSDIKFESIVLSIKDLIAVAGIAIMAGVYYNRIDVLEKEINELKSQNVKVYEKIDHIYEIVITGR